MLDLSNYLSEELIQVSKETDKVFFSNGGFTKAVGRYIKRFPGKRIRPSLLLLTSRSLGYNGFERIKAAAAVELIHFASLIHDDIIDDAKIRHKQPSVHCKWGQDVALLVADYIYTKAFTILTQSLGLEAVSMICEVTSRMCEAELMQVKLKKNNMSYDDYFQIIENKTAFFFSCCSSLGSLIAQSSSKETIKFKNYGFNYGMAFQIIDDTLDLQADKRILGKDIGNDCEGGKKTLPIIRTLEIASVRDMKTLEECFSEGDNIKKVISIIERYDGIEYSKKIAKSYADKAIKCLKDLNGNKDIEIMKELASSVVNRSF